MDKQAHKPALPNNQVRVLKMIHYPPGKGPRAVTMAKLERAAARRRWLMISGAVAAALVIGVLIGRFLLP